MSLKFSVKPKTQRLYLGFVVEAGHQIRKNYASFCTKWYKNLIDGILFEKHLYHIIR
jgi:hypothetical protein